MALPKQVQAQVDALAEYEKQVSDAAAAEAPKPAEDTTNAGPPADQQGQSPAPVTTEPPKPVEDDNSPTWKQRYLSLQGQYNTQVPALQQQVQDLKASMDQLSSRLEAKPAAEPAAKPKADELVTNKDVEAFGEDLVDLARRVARDEFGQREASYTKEIAVLKEQLSKATGQVGEVAQSQAATVSERFFEGLTRALPTWEQVQATKECQAWLASRIPGTPATWNQALQDAANKRDIPAVVEVFDAFFERHPALNPKAKTAPQPANQELQRQVAPGKSSTSSGQPQQSRTYTAREYEMESMRQMRMTQAGRHDEAARIEAELNAALAEGRVRS